MPWIFSYADLGPTTITNVLPNAPFCALPATLENHKVLFRGKSRKWGGGLATAERKKGRTAYGSIYLVSESELKLIDRHYKMYERSPAKINVAATGDVFKAFTYLLKSGEEASPSEEYCKAIGKHLKFFWGQSGKKLNLSDFGISVTPVKKTKKAATSAVATKSKLIRRKPKTKVE
jgi:hypothetical protein